MKKRFSQSQGRYYGASLPAAAGGVDGGALPQWASVEYAEPARVASVAADVVVPGLQALISGAVAGAVGLAACWAMAWPVRWAGALGLAVLALTWAALLIDHRRLLWAVESEQSSIEPEASPAAVEPARLVLEVKHTGSGDKRGFDFLHLGIEPETFLTWARAVLGGQSLAVGAWVGRGRLFSRNQYDALMSELQRAQIVRLTDPANPQNGRELTGAGRAALRACVHGHVTGHDSTAAHSQGVGGTLRSESGQGFGAFVAMIGLVCLVIALAVLAANAAEVGWSWPWEASARRTEALAAARAAEAKAAQYQAEAALRDAQARIEQAQASKVQAENDRLLHDAAAYSIVTQADLVDYYARRGDSRIRETVQFAETQVWRVIGLWLLIVSTILVCQVGWRICRAILRRWDALEAARKEGAGGGKDNA